MAILKDVGETLKALLQQGISELSADDSITFDSPADIESTTTPKLSVFLYQIVESSYLRNTGSEPVGIDRMRYPPLTLDLHYIFTPYAKNREIELIILEKLMQIFYDSPVLREEMLMGSLKGSGNDEIRIVPDNLTLDDVNKLWERFPNRAFKISPSYILTPVRVPSGRPPVRISRVMEKDIDLYRMGKK